MPTARWRWSSTTLLRSWQRSPLDAEVGGILTDEDVAHAALSLEPNTSAALLVWEDTWAAPFAAAVRNANGVILEGARIPREFTKQAMSALDDALA